MDNYKDKYFMRLFLSLICFILDFICAFYSIYYNCYLILIIPLIIIDVLFLYIAYHSFIHRLALRDKFKILHNEKLDLSSYYNKKIEKKNKRLKTLNRLFLISLYSSPILIIIFISIGVFITNSVLLALVFPAFLIVYLLILFFIKDIYSNYDYNDDKELKEELIINKKAICYKGKAYLFKYAGFSIKNDKYKFLFIPIAKIKFSEEIKLKIEGLKDEICNK